MATIQSIFFYLATTAFFFGPSLRLNLFFASVPIFDILLILYTCFSIIGKKPKKTSFLAFAVWSIFRFLTNLFFYKSQPRNIFYLIRLVNFCLLFSYIPKPTPNQLKFLNLVIIANIIFGLIQYFIWPDLTSYSYLGWDPHLNRLTSTFLDPTFTGLIFLLFLLFSYFSNTSIYILLFIYICISLTYSRSTLLSLLLSFLFISIRKKDFLIFFKTLIIVIFTLLILPNTAGEGTKLKRTSTIKAKIENYRQAIHIIVKSPLIGHGYNNLNQARKLNSDNHANFGFDSSLLTITSTTGIIGLFLFLKSFIKLFIHSNTAQKTILISVFTHSLFSNSLLYPWIYFILISYIPTLTKNRK